jgi:hypothetical protein
VDHNTIKHKNNNNKFYPLMEEHSEEGRGSDTIREGLVSNGSSSRGSRTRDRVTLTPEILAMLNRHEPDKAKTSKLLREHLAG